ncbi:MAG: AzlD domain-containing protein [Gammaproteobacteria bacterium]|nr:AzlD domain-containing protein [Gammaproteobacteria bacterium]
MSWLTLLAMAALVFISRYIFLEPKLPIRLGPKILHFLHYTGPAVLTAIWAPIVFHQNGELNLEINNPYFIAAIVATILAITTRNVLISTVFSMALFFMIK